MMVFLPKQIQLAKSPLLTSLAHLKQWTTCFFSCSLTKKILKTWNKTLCVSFMLVRASSNSPPPRTPGSSSPARWVRGRGIWLECRSWGRTASSARTAGGIASESSSSRCRDQDRRPGGKQCVIMLPGWRWYLPECFEPYSKWGRPSPQCSDISESCSTRISQWPRSTACWWEARCSRPRCCTSPPPGPSGHTRCWPRRPPRPSAWTCSRGSPTPSGQTSSATTTRAGNPHCSSHRAPGETTFNPVLKLTLANTDL